MKSGLLRLTTAAVDPTGDVGRIGQVELRTLYGRRPGRSCVQPMSPGGGKLMWNRWGSAIPWCRRRTGQSRRYLRWVSFHFRGDIAGHEVFGKLSVAAFGLWAKAGVWTSVHRSPAFVPDGALPEIADGADIRGEIVELVTAGAWKRASAGYVMEYGRSHDIPRPVWCYDDNGHRERPRGDHLNPGL